MSDESLLVAENVRVSLNGTAWCGATIHLRAGALVRLAGPSGAGKTTLLRALARLQMRAAGRLLLEGTTADEVPAPRWRRAVAYVAQRPALLRGTVADNLSAGFRLAIAEGTPYDPTAAARLLDELGLPADTLRQDGRTLSGGEAVRVALARALLIAPTVLLLDESTAGLDAAAAALLVAVVRRYVEGGARAALIVAHNPDVWGDGFGETVSVERGT